MDHEEREIEIWDGSFEEYREMLIEQKFADNMIEDGDNPNDSRIQQDE